MKDRARILFIGLDAADPDLLGQWVQSGELPTLARLWNEGARATSHTPPGLYVGAVWPSFATGLSPVRHGRYCFRQLRPGSYETERFPVDSIQGGPFWMKLSAAGRRVAVLDVPKTRLTQPVGGIHLADWLIHDAESLEASSWPASLVNDIEQRFMPRAPRCDAWRSSPEQHRSLEENLRRRIRCKADLSLELLSQGNWDLFLTVFSESHCAGHQFWHLHDASHPRHGEAAAMPGENPLKSVYVAIDREVGRLLEAAGPDTMVFLLASHGMGPHYEATYMLGEILWRLEPLCLGGAKAGLSRRQSPLRRLWKHIPEPVRDRLLPGYRRKLFADFSARAFFPVPNNDVFGAVRINLAGREPQGRVQPGVQFEEVCRRLSEALLELENADTGKALVRNVHDVREMYADGDRGHLPDLLIEWNREAPISRVRSPRAGLIEGNYEGCRTGDHRSKGLLMVAGPGVSAGVLPDVSIMDMGPTVASLLGVESPEIDGSSFADSLGLAPAL